MVHEFSTPEGQARLARARQADFEAVAERKQEQAEFQCHQLQPWFNRLTLEHKEQLALWIEERGEDLLLGLIRITDQYNEQMNELENKDI